MEILKNIESLTKVITDVKRKNQLIGFVPTMGSLHEGHISLLERSIAENDFTICSIYVNPTQFNHADDFSSYPRQEMRDIKLLKRINCNVVFRPVDSEMYPKKKKC